MNDESSPNLEPSVLCTCDVKDLGYLLSSHPTHPCSTAIQWALHVARTAYRCCLQYYYSFDTVPSPHHCHQHLACSSTTSAEYRVIGIIHAIISGYYSGTYMLMLMMHTTKSTTMGSILYKNWSDTWTPCCPLLVGAAHGPYLESLLLILSSGSSIITTKEILVPVIYF
jgi:hypothetical protein